MAQIFLKGEPVEGEVAVIDTKDAEEADYNLSPSRWVGQVDEANLGSIPTLVRTLERLGTEEADITSKLLRLLRPLAAETRDVE